MQITGPCDLKPIPDRETPTKKRENETIKYTQGDLYLPTRDQRFIGVIISLFFKAPYLPYDKEEGLYSI